MISQQTGVFCTLFLISCLVYIILEAAVVVLYHKVRLIQVSDQTGVLCALFLISCVVHIRSMTRFDIVRFNVNWKTCRS